jgi:hypothetical protein
MAGHVGIAKSTLTASLIVVLSACAATPRGGDAGVAPGERDARAVNVRTAAAAPMLGAVEMRINGTRPAVGATAPAIFASDFSIGGRHAPISYKASYAVSPGDVVTALGSDIERAPTGIARQRARHQVTLRSPEIASAPLLLDFSTESTGNWTTAGYRTSQRERAQLKWVSARADLSLEWSGAGAPRDGTLALDCDLQGTVRLPVSEGGSRSVRAVTLSGRECRVRAARTPFDQLEAQHLGFGYAWQQTGQQNEVRFSVINPEPAAGSYGADFGSGYELGLRHSREQGPWQANARVALRQPALWHGSVLSAGSAQAAQPGDFRALWTADTTLVRELQRISISATWMHGADPLWFVQNAGTRTDRFGIAMDFSGWASNLMPQLRPQLAMRWRWSQLERQQVLQSSGNELSMTMSMTW